MGEEGKQQEGRTYQEEEWKRAGVEGHLILRNILRCALERYGRPWKEGRDHRRSWNPIEGWGVPGKEPNRYKQKKKEGDGKGWKGIEGTKQGTIEGHRRSWNT